MFRGSSFHTIDPKGRIIVPARFRDVIKASGADSIMITRMDSCLFAYTQDEWGKLEQKILHLPEKSEAMRRFQRVFIGGAHDCKCDAQGRVLIPPFLKQYSGLEKEIVLVGVLDHGFLQRVYSTGFLVQMVPHHSVVHGDHLYFCQHRHVV